MNCPARRVVARTDLAAEDKFDFRELILAWTDL